MGKNNCIIEEAEKTGRVSLCFPTPVMFIFDARPWKGSFPLDGNSPMPTGILNRNRRVAMRAAALQRGSCARSPDRGRFRPADRCGRSARPSIAPVLTDPAHQNTLSGERSRAGLLNQDT